MLGLIDPDGAKKIGEVLNVHYLVYGNVTDVSIAVEKALVNVTTVKAHIVLRIMDVDTGTDLTPQNLYRALVQTAGDKFPVKLSGFSSVTLEISL